MLKSALNRAMRDGGVVFYGCGVATWEMRGNKAWINPVWVHPDWRRLGTGTRLIRMLGYDAGDKGAQRLCAKSMKNRPDVTAMLKKVGMTMIRETGEDLLWQDELKDLFERWSNEVE